MPGYHLQVFGFFDDILRYLEAADDNGLRISDLAFYGGCIRVFRYNHFELGF